MRGGGSFWREVTGQHLKVTLGGVSFWQPGAARPARHRLEQIGASSEVQRTLEALLVQPPGR